MIFLEGNLTTLHTKCKDMDTFDTVLSNIYSKEITVDVLKHKIPQVLVL